jgi:hypothetical protein
LEGRDLMSMFGPPIGPPDPAPHPGGTLPPVAVRPPQPMPQANQ